MTLHLHRAPRTDQLADAAWAWFQEIEAAGGFRAATALVAERLAATRAARQRDECIPHFTVRPRQDVLASLQHGRAGSRPTERETKLHADCAAADHDEALWEGSLLEELIARQRALDALDRRPGG